MMVAGGDQSLIFDQTLIEALPQNSKDAIIKKYELMKKAIDELSSKCEKVKVTSGKNSRHFGVFVVF